MNLLMEIERVRAVKRQFAALNFKLRYEFSPEFLEKTGLADRLQAMKTNLDHLSLSTLEGADEIIKGFRFCGNEVHACSNRVGGTIPATTDQTLDNGKG